MIIDDPEMVEAVERASDHYEAALLANDLPALDASFWQDERMERIAPNEEQLGPEAARRARLNWPLADLPRERLSRRIICYGNTAASVNIVFRRLRDGRIGRQSQTWVCFDGAWRIVTAHISFRENA